MLSGVLVNTRSRQFSLWPKTDRIVSEECCMRTLSKKKYSNLVSNVELWLQVVMSFMLMLGALKSPKRIKFVARVTSWSFSITMLPRLIDPLGCRYTVRLLTHVLCKPTHFFFHSFIATMPYCVQTSFNSLMKDWVDKYDWNVTLWLSFQNN